MSVLADHISVILHKGPLVISNHYHLNPIVIAIKARSVAIFISLYFLITRTIAITFFTVLAVAASITVALFLAVLLFAGFAVVAAITADLFFTALLFFTFTFTATLPPCHSCYLGS